MSQALRARLFDELDAIVLIDPHTHINPHAPAATTLADVLGYHYYTELAHSAGMPKARIEEPGLDPKEKVGRLVDALAPIENTIQYSWLIEMAQKLFGFADDRLTAENWEALYDAAAEKMRQPDWPDQVLAQHLLEGLIRVIIFVAYLLIVSRSAEIRRTFQYHGAEHMTIHALEHEDPLDIEHVRRYPTAHPRCGTEFLVIFIILSIVMFSVLAGQDLVVSIVGRVLLVPVIASLAYELLRFGARHRDRIWLRWLYLPGIWLQAITTKQPDDSMIEVAIASMQEALAANHEAAPAGSWDPPRRPIPMGNTKAVTEQESAPDQIAR